MYQLYKKGLDFRKEDPECKQIRSGIFE